MFETEDNGPRSKKKSSGMSRRRFLRTAAAGGASAVVLTTAGVVGTIAGQLDVAPQTPQPPEPQPLPQPQQGPETGRSPERGLAPTVLKHKLDDIGDMKLNLGSYHREGKKWEGTRLYARDLAKVVYGTDYSNVLFFDMHLSSGDNNKQVRFEQWNAGRTLINSTSSGEKVGVNDNEQLVVEALNSFPDNSDIRFSVRANLREVEIPEYSTVGNVGCIYDAQIGLDGEASTMSITYVVGSPENGYAIGRKMLIPQDAQGSENNITYTYTKYKVEGVLMPDFIPVARSLPYTLSGEVKSEDTMVKIAGKETLPDESLREEFDAISANFESTLEEVK